MWCTRWYQKKWRSSPIRNRACVISAPSAARSTGRARSWRIHASASASVDSSRCTTGSAGTTRCTGTPFLSDTRTASVSASATARRSAAVNRSASSSPSISTRSAVLSTVDRGASWCA
ncbi:hypothetical protein SCALM49S_06583 [Streptomyces californicus]